VDDAGVDVEALEDDVAAIVGDGGTNPGCNEFLDLGDDLGGLAVIGDVVFQSGRLGLCRIGDHRRAGDEMVHDCGERLGLEVRPVGVFCLGDRDEVRSEEDVAHAVDAEQRGRQRRGRRLVDRDELVGRRRRDILAGQEFQGGRVGRGLGLDEHVQTLGGDPYQLDGPKPPRTQCGSPEVAI
jgi:hypothetical protein